MRFPLVSLMLQVRDVPLEQLELLAVLVPLALGQLFPARLVRLAGFAQEAGLLAELGVLFGEFGEAALQLTQLEGLVAVLAVGGFQVSAGVVVGLLQVAVVFVDGLEGFGVC